MHRYCFCYWYSSFLIIYNLIWLEWILLLVRQSYIIIERIVLFQEGNSKFDIICTPSAVMCIHCCQDLSWSRSEIFCQVQSEEDQLDIVDQNKQILELQQYISLFRSKISHRWILPLIQGRRRRAKSDIRSRSDGILYYFCQKGCALW